MKFLQKIRFALFRDRASLPLKNPELETAVCDDWSRSMIKSVLEESAVEYLFDKEDDCFYCRLPWERENDVLFVLMAKSHCIHARSIAPHWTIDNLKLTEALLFCNKWNCNTIFPKAHIDAVNNLLVAEFITPLSKKAGKKFISELLLPNMFAANVTFWREAVKQSFLPAVQQETELPEQ